MGLGPAFGIGRGPALLGMDFGEAERGAQGLAFDQVFRVIAVGSGAEQPAEIEDFFFDAVLRGIVGPGGGDFDQ